MSESPGRLVEIAVRFLAVGNVEAAMDALRQLLADDPDQADAHALLALCLMDRRRLYAARREAEISITLDPESPLAHRAMARTLLASRRFSDASRHIDLLIDSDPNDTEGFELRAELNRLRRKTDAMVRDLERILQLDPENVEARVHLGHHHLGNGRIAEANAESRAALELEPENQEALLLRGWIALRRGEVEEARDHAVWVLRDDPSDRAALALMAAVKAKTSPLLGLWWKWNAWMGELGDGRAIIVLLVAFVIYRVLSIFLTYDLQQPVAARVIEFAWLGIVAYTWIGPALFIRRLQAELKTIHLRDF